MTALAAREVASGTGAAESAYWRLMRECTGKRRAEHVRDCVALVVASHDPDWAYEVLYASYLLTARDVERPDAPTTALVTDDEQRRLVAIIARHGNAERIYHTIRTVFLSVEQRREMLRALRKTADRRWVAEAFLDLRLTNEEIATLNGEDMGCM